MTHALLAPSSALRWINCPPSARINADAGGRDTLYTREGTIAHAAAEAAARAYFFGDDTSARMRELRAEYDALKRTDTEDRLEDARAITAGAGAYVDVLKDFAAAYATPPHIALEQHVTMDDLSPECAGTADCVMIGDATLHVADYKYGKGVAVSAEHNPQMMLYAYGALRAYDMIYDIDTIRMSIVQPRLSAEPATWEIRRTELEAWAAEVVRPAASLAVKGEGEMCAGAWCRWCSNAGRCRAQYAAYTALEDFGERLPPVLSNAEVARALKLGAELDEWLKQLEAYALRACLQGEDIPGYKAVEGRSRRVWTDAKAAFDAARAGGIDDAILYTREPVTLAALEKVLGKQSFGDMLGAYVATPPGKPTLAPSGDKRPPITRLCAAEDFAEPITAED